MGFHRAIGKNQNLLLAILLSIPLMGFSKVVSGELTTWDVALSIPLMGFINVLQIARRGEWYKLSIPLMGFRR